MEQKQKNHEEKMEQLKKHFKSLKIKAILIWLGFNLIVDVAAFLFLSMEVVIFAVLIALCLSTLLMFNYLKRLNKIKIAQETKLLEDTPMNRLKF